MVETVSLQDLFKTLKKRTLLIFLTTLLAVTAAGVISYQLLTPVYQASTQILVNQQKGVQNQFNTQDIQTNLQLINTYNVIIKSPAILSKVIEDLDLSTTLATLNGKITVNSAQNSQVVNVSVQDSSPNMAVEIANTTAEVFRVEIQKLMNVDNVTILSPAVLSNNPSPIKPDPFLNMAIAAVIGLMLGVGIAFLLEYLDTTLKTEQDVEELLGLPIIGLVSKITVKDMPDDKKKTKRKRRKRGDGLVQKKETANVSHLT
ncbi:Wzz/FepE/Etk N-terminal domain-containing protein [Sporosarcina thermotolerans]|uniref:Wzz/FepE/Etk N-terminal domain-containing protein n=1 Tax=Sporosarcina thermotolerans TaxID=633404 RepID=A0AAW9AAT0_9BACL|nr:Wzz/FepE/Etk N-terminal domain-containing protein [Sporosarcina thermotolerans]MDW0116291.1 Wzz/FepE/Etk N-terminal domain-containing protein [Sporosarcina thermotolerans]WHT48260.1 Wzz/FepE/Etk N-terminal domain-containing protein [Sporosarcina thermotolerans]